MDKFTKAYIEAMLWSTCLEPYGECASCGKNAVLCQFDNDGNGPEWTLCSNCDGDPQGNHHAPPAYDNYSIDNISTKLMEMIKEDCASFQEDNKETLADWYEKCGESEERAGHDFWLTRERHGAGFWDRWSNSTTEGIIGMLLTDSAHSYGEMYLYVGDDGMIHGS